MGVSAFSAGTFFLHESLGEKLYGEEKERIRGSVSGGDPLGGSCSLCRVLSGKCHERGAEGSVCPIWGGNGHSQGNGLYGAADLSADPYGTDSVRMVPAGGSGRPAELCECFFRVQKKRRGFAGGDPGLHHPDPGQDGNEAGD